MLLDHIPLIIDHSFQASNLEFSKKALFYKKWSQTISFEKKILIWMIKKNNIPF
jgi:hypothetical protein